MTAELACRLRHATSRYRTQYGFVPRTVLEIRRCTRLSTAADSIFAATPSPVLDLRHVLTMNRDVVLVCLPALPHLLDDARGSLFESRYSMNDVHHQSETI